MVVVGGPPGSGKSTLFPVRERGIDFFNADDVAASLNQSYQRIPPIIRAEANRRFEAFIEDHIKRGESFAIETTLRSRITFDQVRVAHEKGFEVWLLRRNSFLVEFQGHISAAQRRPLLFTVSDAAWRRPRPL